MNSPPPQPSEHDQRVAAAAEGFSPAQVKKALALIAGDRIKRTEFANEFIVIGSDGDHYLCAADACACRAGFRRCYHQLGVRLFLLADEQAA
jgi:hypothetical protein